MIRKYARVDAPPELVRSIFADVDSWPLWMPGIESVTVVERNDDHALLDVVGRYLGRRIEGRVDCRFEPKGLLQSQLSGWMRKWDTHWKYRTPPDGRGTTLSCEVDIDLGLVGVLTPRRMVQHFVDRVFTDTVEQVGRRARELAAESRQEAADFEPESAPLLQVFETAAGLEVWIAGRRFFLETSD